MTTLHTLLLVLACAFVVAFLLGFAQPPQDPIRQLKARFVTLSRLPRARAEAELLDRVEALAERYPGQSYRWYLEWLVTDLERAKR